MLFCKIYLYSIFCGICCCRYGWPFPKSLIILILIKVINDFSEDQYRIILQQGKSEGFDSCDRPSNLLKLDSNRFFSPCEPEIWWMTPKNNPAPLLCYLKLFAPFRSHWWIQAGVTVRKRQIWVKFDDFFSRVTLKFDWWPWKTIEGTSSFLFQALCIISYPLVNSNWSYSPETPNLGQNQRFF